MLDWLRDPAETRWDMLFDMLRRVVDEATVTFGTRAEEFACNDRFEERDGWVLLILRELVVVVVLVAFEESFSCNGCKMAAGRRG